MPSKRYMTNISAYVDCTGNRNIDLMSLRDALAYPVDCVEVQVRAGDRVALYVGQDELIGRDQLKALDCESLFQIIADHSPVSICLNLVDPYLQSASPEEYAALESLVRAAGLIGCVQLKGIEPHAMAAVHHGAPNLMYWVSLVPGFGEATFPPFCESLIRRIHNSGAIGLHTNYRFVTRLLQRYMADNDLMLSVQGAERERDLRRLLTLPVDNIVTSRVSAVLDLRSRVTNPFPTQRAMN